MDKKDVAVLLLNVGDISTEEAMNDLLEDAEDDAVFFTENQLDLIERALRTAFMYGIQDIELLLTEKSEDPTRNLSIDDLHVGLEYFFSDAFDPTAEIEN